MLLLKICLSRIQQLASIRLLQVTGQMIHSLFRNHWLIILVRVEAIGNRVMLGAWVLLFIRRRVFLLKDLFQSLSSTILIHFVHLRKLLLCQISNSILLIVVVLFLSSLLPLPYDALISWHLCLLRHACFGKLDAKGALILLTTLIIPKPLCTLARHDLIPVKIRRPLPLTVVGLPIEVIDLSRFFIVVCRPDGPQLLVSHVVERKSL